MSAWYLLFVFGLTVAALNEGLSEKSSEEPSEVDSVEKRSRNPYSWMKMADDRQARNPYSWRTQGKRASRNPYSWMATKGKRAVRFNDDRAPRNPYSWQYFDKRTRNPYSWMNF